MMQLIKKRCQDSKRIDWIDTAKGLGIILVVLGHTWDIPHWLYCAIYGFHMPLFFLLSGLTCNFDGEISTRKYIIQQFFRYMRPYMVLCGVNLILQCMWLMYVGSFQCEMLLKYICGIIYCYANTEWMPNCSPLWFLPGIMFAKIFAFAAYRLARSNKYRATGVVVFLTVFAMLCNYLKVPRLPWNILPAMVGSVFVWAGYCLRSDDRFMQTGYGKITDALIIAALLLTPWIVWNCPGMNQNYYDNGLLFVISGFGYSFLLIRIAMLLRNNRFLTSFLGKGTMVIMGFNYFARTMAIEIYYLIPVVRNYPIRPIACFPITMTILMLMLLCKNRLREKTEGRHASHAV